MRIVAKSKNMWPYGGGTVEDVKNSVLIWNLAVLI